jgi:hypothetical protein
MEPVLTHSIALMGSSQRWAPELQSAFGTGLQLKVYALSAPLRHGHALYLTDIRDLMDLSNAQRLALVADGVLHAGNVVILEEDKLLYAPQVEFSTGMAAVLKAIFKPKLPTTRNPAVPQLWLQLMSETEVLACQCLCKHIKLETEASGDLTNLIEALKINLHLIQATQERLKHLLQELSKHKVVSSDARQLLDSANALLMVHSLTAIYDFDSHMEAEDSEYGQLVHQTFCKFAEQLSTALFRYNETMAFHWFFTEQKIHFPAAV